MQAVVLEKTKDLRLRDIPLEEPLGANDVRIRIRTVGICGSDLHYYQHGAIGPFVVREPMVLGHEASGVVEAVGFDEGAMVEPLAVGMHAANKARIRPGDVAVVLGAGPIGIVTALAALAGGCSQVIITDVQLPKLKLAASLGPIVPVNVREEKLESVVQRVTGGWGADIVFEATGRPEAFNQALEALCPAGYNVLIGMPGAPVPFDIVAAQVKEARVESVFRHAHVYPRALALMGSRKIDMRPLITDRYAFSNSVSAFDYACAMRPESVKVQIELE